MSIVREAYLVKREAPFVRERRDVEGLRDTRYEIRFTICFTLHET